MEFSTVLYQYFGPSLVFNITEICNKLIGLGFQLAFKKKGTEKFRGKSGKGLSESKLDQLLL